MGLTSIPPDVTIGPDGITTTNLYGDSDTTERTLPRSILLLSGDDSSVTPFQALWDSGATNSIHRNLNEVLETQYFPPPE